VGWGTRTQLPLMLGTVQCDSPYTHAEGGATSRKRSGSGPKLAREKPRGGAECGNGTPSLLDAPISEKIEPRPCQLSFGLHRVFRGRCSDWRLTHGLTLVRPAGSLEVPPSTDHAIAPAMPPCILASKWSEMVINQLKRSELRNCEGSMIEHPSEPRAEPFMRLS
jgi:hypothetical protein